MKKLKILILDDDSDFAESIYEALETQGHETKVFFCGEETIKVFKEEEFDIAFMDVNLPGMS